MKKKFLLVVAVMLIVVTAMAMLVGCTQSDPVKFMDKFKEADNIVVYNYEDIELSRVYITALSGNIIMEALEVDNVIERCIYYEWIDENTMIEYTGGEELDNEWVVAKWTREDFYHDLPFATAKEFFGIKLGIADYVSDVAVEFIEYEFDKNNYKKKDGWFIGKEGTDVEETAFKIKGKELFYQYAYNDKDSYDYKLVIGYDKIYIPEKALQAAKNLK